MGDKSLAAKLELTCGACQLQLSEYVRRELSGEPIARLMPAVTYHIATCPACETHYYRQYQTEGRQKSLAELRAIGDRYGVSAQFDGALASLPAISGFSEGQVRNGRAWYDRATSKLRLLDLQLVGLFARPSQSPAEVLAGLQGAPLRADTEAANHASIEIDDELTMALRVLPSPGGDAEFCQVEVTIEMAGRFGDYSGIEVTVIDAAGEHTGTTDEFGKVHFDRVPRDETAPLGLTVRLD